MTLKEKNQKLKNDTAFFIIFITLKKKVVKIKKRLDNEKE